MNSERLATNQGVTIQLEKAVNQEVKVTVMKSKLALISTGSGVVEAIMAIVRELSPETEVINIVDDCIARGIAANGNVVPPWIFRRMATYMVLAEEAGADAAL